MKLNLKRPDRKLFSVQNRRVRRGAATIRCVEQPDFPTTQAQVTRPVVDTAGKDAPLSSQEGI